MDLYKTPSKEIIEFDLMTTSKINKYSFIVPFRSDPYNKESDLVTNKSNNN